MDARKTFFSIPLETLAAFSHDGHVYRSFNHLIAPRHGALLLVPVGLGQGDFRQVIDRCPVPWEEAWDVLDSQPMAANVNDVRGLPEQLLALDDSGWQRETFRLARREKPSRRFVHISGMRYADL